MKHTKGSDSKDPRHPLSKDARLYLSRKGPEAIYLASCEDLLRMEDLGIRVTDDGFTVRDDKAKRMHVAVEWKDQYAFEDLLVARLTGSKR